MLSTVIRNRSVKEFISVVRVTKHLHILSTNKVCYSLMFKFDFTLNTAM